MVVLTVVALYSPWGVNRGRYSHLKVKKMWPGAQKGTARTGGIDTFTTSYILSNKHFFNTLISSIIFSFFGWKLLENILITLFCKAKRQYLLTCKVSRYCLFGFARQHTAPAAQSLQQGVVDFYRFGPVLSAAGSCFSPSLTLLSWSCFCFGIACAGFRIYLMMQSASLYPFINHRGAGGGGGWYHGCAACLSRLSLRIRTLILRYYRPHVVPRPTLHNVIFHTFKNNY